MSTYKNSEYILWTDDNGQYWQRKRRTGEQTIISKEVAQVIWSEMKREEKYLQKITFIDEDRNKRSRLLSLDAIAVESSKLNPTPNEQWLSIKDAGYEEVDVNILEERLFKKLTKRQRQIYQLVVKEAYSPSECAAICKLSLSTVSRTMKLFRDKVCKIFGQYASFGQKSSLDK